MTTANQLPSEVALDAKTEVSEEEVEKIVESIVALDKAVHVEQLKFDIVAQGPWSPSKIKTLKKCPFQYYLRYVLRFKLPEHYQTQDDPYSANRGKAAHAILEYAMLGKTIPVSYKMCKEEYVGKKILTEEQWNRGVEPLLYNITNFVERIESLGRSSPIKRALTELRIGVTRDYEPTGFFADNVWLRGVIDLVLMLECKDILIIDHKTGGTGTTKYYEDQLDFYKLLFHFGMEPVVGAQSAIHFIEAGEIPMAKYTNAKEIETKLKNELEWSLHGVIDSAKEKGYFKHVRGSYCKWCDYDAIGCKSGQLKPLELSTKRFFEIKQVKG